MSHTFSDGQTLCPYNPSHVISRQRAIPHLAKCRQQHPHLMEKVGICPYNQGHHIPMPDMTTHLTTCEDHCSSRSISIAASQNRQQRLEASSIPRPADNPSQILPSVADDINEWI